MKFSEILYKRPEIDDVRQRMESLFQAFQEAPDGEHQWEQLLKILEVRNHVQTMGTLVSIRHSVDTRGRFYDQENDYFDQVRPQFEELNDRFYGLLLESPHQELFEKRLGSHFFEVIKLSRKVFSPEIMELLALENQEVSRYEKLLAAAQIPFREEVYTLSGIQRFFEEPDRLLRKEANEAYWGYFEEHAEEFDEIYDRLVKLRHEMALKLGYENFIGMAYDRMGRTDYGPEDVAVFRAGIREHIVPQAQKIFADQAKRLELEKLLYYDEAFVFPSGNPKPQGDKRFMEEQALSMYENLSEETGEFFRMLLDRELMDLEQKPGKGPGGYCTFMEEPKLPFIFSNFNGTSADVDVLTHEFGHAFQTWCSRHHLLEEQRFPGMEAAEIHSMGMEYIAYPWMRHFFGNETDKYFYAHQSSMLCFLPYGALVDEFQHRVYEKPEMTAEERKNTWRELEKIYNPWHDFENNEFLEQGGRWQRQGHIYGVPFYYIDYCLAQIVAMEIYGRSREDFESLWQDYLKICEVGGTLPFLGILKEGNFANPFRETTVHHNVQTVVESLAGMNPLDF